MPINSKVEFHFILAFSVDYTNGNSPSPSNGKFNIFWESNHMGPGEIASIKNGHSNVKVAISLGGDSVGHGKAFFASNSTESWVKNAVSSLTNMVKEYNLDGIDIDYEHFHSDPSTFAECIGQLITRLKKSGIISFASIAPFDNEEVQSHYMALWKKYGHVIDYVNFQFYAYDRLSVSQFVSHFKKQASKYAGGQILASFISGEGGGLKPNDGFFEACSELKKQGILGGIFVWCAEESKEQAFEYEKKAQDFLA